MGVLDFAQDPGYHHIYALHYNGWDASGNITPSGVSIHHPRGDERKISSFSSTPQTASYAPMGTNNAWRVQWNRGTTEGGSSGSPLFNSEKNIVGQLYGGVASCNNLNGYDYYGKFSVSWDLNSHINRQLKNCLEPLNSGIKKISSLASNSLYGPPVIKINETVSYRSLISSNVKPVVSSNLTLESWNSRLGTIVVKGKSKGLGKITYANNSRNVYIEEEDATRINNRIAFYLVKSFEPGTINIECIEKSNMSNENMLKYTLVDILTGNIIKQGVIDGSKGVIRYNKKGTYVINLVKEDSSTESHKVYVN